MNGRPKQPPGGLTKKCLKKLGQLEKQFLEERTDVSSILRISNPFLAVGFDQARRASLATSSGSTARRTRSRYRTSTSKVSPNGPLQPGASNRVHVHTLFLELTAVD